MVYNVFANDFASTVLFAHLVANVAQLDRATA